jgi:hypothetical protein
VFTVPLVSVSPSFVKSDIESSFWNVSIFVKKTGSVQASLSEKCFFEHRKENLRTATYKYNKKENLNLYWKLGV